MDKKATYRCAHGVFMVRCEVCGPAIGLLAKCLKCSKEFDWGNELWDISFSKEYKCKVHKCECGAEQMLNIPITEEKIKLWNLIR